MFAGTRRTYRSPLLRSNPLQGGRDSAGNSRYFGGGFHLRHPGHHRRVYHVGRSGSDAVSSAAEHRHRPAGDTSFSRRLGNCRARRRVSFSDRIFGRRSLLCSQQEAQIHDPSADSLRRALWDCRLRRDVLDRDASLACIATVFLDFRRGGRNPHSYYLRWFTYLADRTLFFTGSFASRQN